MSGLEPNFAGKICYSADKLPTDQAARIWTQISDKFQQTTKSTSFPNDSHWKGDGSCDHLSPIYWRGMKISFAQHKYSCLETATIRPKPQGPPGKTSFYSIVKTSHFDPNLQEQSKHLWNRCCDCSPCAYSWKNSCSANSSRISPTLVLIRLQNF